MADLDALYASDGIAPAVRATISQERLPTDMDIITDSVENWPHKGIATSGTPDDDGIIIPSTECVFEFVLSGTIIHIVDFAPGYSDMGNTENQIVILKPTTYHNDSLVDAISNFTALPDGGTTGQSLVKASNADQDVEWSGNAYAIEPKEVPAGAIDGTNRTFTTLRPYVGGTLQGYINGWAQSGYVSEDNPATGAFTFDVAPEVGDDVRVYYHYETVTLTSGNTLDGYTLSGILQVLYPIGAVYVSGSNSMPALITSIGTWTRVEGRFIVGASDSDTAFSNGTTGGSKTHTHTVTGLAAHIFVTTSGNVMQEYKSTNNTWVQTGTRASRGTASSDSGAQTGGTPIDGSTDASNNLPPYKSKYMWERIA